VGQREFEHHGATEAKAAGAAEAVGGVGRTAFEHHGATELTEMQSNGAAKNDDDASGKDAATAATLEDREYGGDGELKSDRNRISAWQAGWNVTNAIQVNSPLNSRRC